MTSGSHLGCHLSANGIEDDGENCWIECQCGYITNGCIAAEDAVDEAMAHAAHATRETDLRAFGEVLNELHSFIAAELDRDPSPSIADYLTGERAALAAQAIGAWLEAEALA